MFAAVLHFLEAGESVISISETSFGGEVHALTISSSSWCMISAGPPPAANSIRSPETQLSVSVAAGGDSSAVGGTLGAGGGPQQYHQVIDTTSNLAIYRLQIATPFTSLVAY